MHALSPSSLVADYLSKAGLSMVNTKFLFNGSSLDSSAALGAVQELMGSILTQEVDVRITPLDREAAEAQRGVTCPRHTATNWQTLTLQ